jgi:hypothetical protein
MMVVSALMGTLEAVFPREPGSRAGQARVLLFRCGAQVLLVLGNAAWMGLGPVRGPSGAALGRPP